MANNFKTYFGVPIPPFKEEKVSKDDKVLKDGKIQNIKNRRTYTIIFVFQGSIPSLKNSRRATPVLKEAHAYLKEKGNQQTGLIALSDARKSLGKIYAKVMPHLKYEKWLKEQTPIIEQQRSYWLDRLQDKGLTFPLYKAKMNCTFYFAQDYNIDMISKQESIQDLLTHLKIIADDNYKIINHITTKAANYKGEMTKSICLVTLTFKL
jgi:hypothetical protein